MAKVYNRKRGFANRAKLARWNSTDGQVWAAVHGGGVSSSVVPKVTIAEDLMRLAEALPSEPPRGRGRPRKDAPVALSRQQLRYRERMLEKARGAIQKLEGGQS